MPHKYIKKFHEEIMSSDSRNIMVELKKIGLNVQIVDQGFDDDCSPTFSKYNHECEVCLSDDIDLSQYIDSNGIANMKIQYVEKIINSMT